MILSLVLAGLLSLQSPQAAEAQDIQGVGYVTDVEGSLKRLHAFFAKSPDFELGSDGRFHLKPGHVFVFGGDAPDRYLGSMAVIEELLRIAAEAPDRTFLIAGNRDLNKMRIPMELSPQAMTRNPVWYSFVSEDIWNKESVQTTTPEARLKFIFGRTMGAGAAFDLLRTEIAQKKGLSDPAEVADSTVVQTVLDELRPNGNFGRMLSMMKLAVRVGNTLFIHGGITPESVGRVPDDTEFYEDAEEWLARLDIWYKKQFAEWSEQWGQWNGLGRRPGQELMEYPMPALGQPYKQESLVYGRNVDAHNNPVLPPAAVIEYLKRNGIERVVVGHTPTGDFPISLRTLEDDFEMVSGDVSYSASESNSPVIHFFGDRLQETWIRGEVRHQDFWYPAEARMTLNTATPLGKGRTDNSRVIARRVSDDALVGFQLIPGFKIATSLWPNELALPPLRLQDPPLLARPSRTQHVDGPVGYYPGSFDPVAGHRKIITELLDRLHLKKMFVLVNVQGPKDYSASVIERIDMLKIALRGLEDRVEIRGEPFQGKEAFFQHLRQTTTGTIYSIGGEDSFYTIPAAVRSAKDREWVLVLRPTQELRVSRDDLPEGTQVIEIPEISGISSSAIRDAIAAGLPTPELDPELTEWILRHGLYQPPTDPAAKAQLEERYHSVFKEFYAALKSHLSRLPLEDIPAPPFKANQSPGAWLEKFILWTSEQNRFTPVQASFLADAARVIFAARGWEAQFPIVKMKSGVPSGRCLWFLQGGL